VFAPARSAGAVKCDGYLKHRARQVQQLVLRRLAMPRLRLESGLHELRRGAAVHNGRTVTPAARCGPERGRCRCGIAADAKHFERGHYNAASRVDDELNDGASARLDVRDPSRTSACAQEPGRVVHLKLETRGDV
jgi:hypothetical protein